MREFTHSLTIEAPPAAVLDAFFDPDALAAWWRAKRSLCVRATARRVRRRMGADRVAGRGLRPARRRVARNRDRLQAGPRVLPRRCCSGYRRTAIRSVRWRSRRPVPSTGTAPSSTFGSRAGKTAARWTRYYELIARPAFSRRRSRTRRTEATARSRSATETWRPDVNRRAPASTTYDLAAASRSSTAPCARSGVTLTNTITDAGSMRRARRRSSRMRLARWVRRHRSIGEHRNHAPRERQAGASPQVDPTPQESAREAEAPTALAPSCRHE